ncbi:SDR family oxidoreductase [Brevibacillus sp. SYSU BS000544]|uniref:SDR family oxidoreductase n=1 Tax=Brevibacillus sp. SYSU BS000544 TaxID=3416443 RepID=UPI003CE4BF5D
MTKVAIITGASSGFGLLTAVELAKSGYQTIATMRDLNRQQPLLELAKREGVESRLQIMQLDVTQENQVQEVVGRVVEQYGAIDLLVNNAGYAKGGLVEEIPMSEWRKQFDTNVFGLIQMTQVVLPYMRSKRSGTIINLSSISGLIGFPMMAPYVASKHAVEGFSEALRLEVASFGIRVVLVEPGAFQTAIWEKGLSTADATGAVDYSHITGKVMSQAQQIAQTGEDPLQVAKLIVQISQSSSPSLRYPIGKGTKQAIWLKKIVPWSILEKVLGKQLH